MLHKTKRSDGKMAERKCFIRGVRYIGCVAMVLMIFPIGMVHADTRGLIEGEEKVPVSTPSQTQKLPLHFIELPSPALIKGNKITAISSLGDIWDDWTGKTSFEFLNGKQGDGTEKRPYLIKNREQLMGVSELTAMGMLVPEAEGVKYAGDYSGCYFALGNDIDLQGVSWIPIGFYRDSSEVNGEVPYPFMGHFDGNGKRIKNFKLDSFPNTNNVGLFGAIADSSIENLTILPEKGSFVKGNERTGIVVGYAQNSRIRNVTVKNAAISSTGITGGIAGEISESIIENATCDKVAIDAKDGTETIYAGGIAGVASSSTIMDCTVFTGNNSTGRIQGTGYVGGIVGYQNASNIFNTYVSGTIGGNHSTAIGGITGEYGAGKLKVARFAGTIGNSNLGSLAREGTFLGTRAGVTNNFNYIEDVAYLFADTESKISASVCGSEIDDDNDYTYDAHIGYWHAGDNYYTLVQGGVKKSVSSQYFYEELENGILTILDEESGDDTLDHFAPDSMGKPVRGYLINVNQIDTIANGQNFYDVASLEVRGSSQYSKPIDKEHRGAIAPDTSVIVTTAAQNTDTEKYQMEGSPFYMNEKGKKSSTAYSESSHAYGFTMPEENISVSATYKKVAVDLKVNPESYTFAVTQTRTGNRKNPVKTTEIKNKEGKLIARYINGVLDRGTQVQPVHIQAVIDANNDVADNRIKWSIDDPELITLEQNDDEEADGYTEKSASLSVNLGATFFQSIIEEAERKQAEGSYQNKIPQTIYGAGHQSGGIAVLTAQTRPSTSFEGKPCTANSRINVTFQILDQTLVATEGAVLDKQALTYTVKRTLTGDRRAPEERITVTAPQSLTATFTPDFFSREEVNWTSSDDAVIQVVQDQGAYREASILAVSDSAWIRNIMATDDGIRSNDPYASVSGSGSRETVVTVNGRDRLGNQASASCQVTVHFVTDDQTRVVPEGISLNQREVSYSLIYQMAGDIDSRITEKKGFEEKKLLAVVLPTLTESMEHRPYDQTVLWTSSDPDALSVDSQGRILPVDGGAWIKEAMRKAPYKSERVVKITATARDGGKAAECLVTLTFQANATEHSRRSSEGGSFGGGGGSRSVGVTKAGNTQGPAAPAGAVTGIWTQTANGKWIFASNRTFANEWAYISNPYATAAQEKASWFRFDADGFMVTGWYTDVDGTSYYLKAISDGTQGQMLTGWQVVENAWYYFNPVSDGTRGKVLKHTVTPDGYTVNETGQWITDGKVVTA